MVIDSSVLTAIVLGEPDAAHYVEVIALAFEADSPITIPASVLVEAGIVCDQRGRGEQLNALVEKLQPDVCALDRTIAELARKAFRNFGRGRHKANLNFGDCMSYATARYLQLPLLYKGVDFAKTDLPSALPK